MQVNCVEDQYSQAFQALWIPLLYYADRVSEDEDIESPQFNVGTDFNKANENGQLCLRVKVS